MTLRKLESIRDKLFCAIVHELPIDLTIEEEILIKDYLLEEVFISEYTNSKIEEEKVIEECNEAILSSCLPDDKLIFLNTALIQAIKQDKLKLKNVLYDIQGRHKHLKHYIFFSDSLKFLVYFYNDNLYKDDECFQYFKNKLNDNFIEILKYLTTFSYTFKTSLKSPFVQDFCYIFKNKILSEYKSGTLGKKEIYFLKMSLKYFIIRKEREIANLKKFFIKNKEVKN